MKINDILECVNRTLVAERKAKNLPEVLGHFVFHIGWERKMGTIKTFHTQIDFINMSKGTPNLVVSESYTVECPTEKLEEMKELMTIRILEAFFKVLRLGRGKGDYENFVKGTFEGWT